MLAIALWQIACWYLASSLILYLLYWKDKRAAVRGGWRISEATLHLWALLGGWIGGYIAQQRLRHKTQKTRFLVLFWLSVLLNILITITILNPHWITTLYRQWIGRLV